MELKGRLEGIHQSISDSEAVPAPAGSLSLTARGHAQHSGDGTTARPFHHPLSVFGSRPRPHQLAFLLWDGMRHLCLLRHSDLRASSTTCLATPRPVIIQVPIDRLASELCLPSFGGEYYPSGSGVVITVVVADGDNVDCALHRCEYYLDGRDSKTVKVDFANGVIRILCLENVLEDRFRCPGMSYISSLQLETNHDQAPRLKFSQSSPRSFTTSRPRKDS